MMKVFIVFLAVIGIGSIQPTYAADKESGSAKAIKKLQMMVRDANAERDRLTTENAKIAAELEQLKKQTEQEKKTTAALADKHTNELASQKSIAVEIHNQLDNTTVRLREVIEKYNALNQSKTELAAQHGNLQNTQQFTASELKKCESKNTKMFEGAKQVITGYQRCQNKGIVDTLIDSEPVTQIDSVELETIIQEFEDKLIKQKFQGTENTKK